jgi:uncharacterized hydrophobic protein (TIGR00271 family)
MSEDESMETSQPVIGENNNICDLAYSNIREGAVLDRTYVIMNVLATIIACFGLFENSPAVVIGAMVVAMLLGPIIGIALGVAVSDNTLLRKALVSEIIGVVIVYITALIIGLLFKNLQITNEILARTAPNFIDLMIAIAGGAAGAYALLSPRIGLSLVGVAVAIALVPPLSASAILLARGEFSLAVNAALLALTNIVAIEFIASVIIIVFRCNRASFRLKSLIKTIPRYSITIVILLVLGIFLLGSLRSVVIDQTYKTQTYKKVQQEISVFPGAYLEDVRYDTTIPNSEIVRAVVRAPIEFTPAQVAAIEAKLPNPPNGRVLDFRLRYVQTTVITGTGYMYNDTQDIPK